MGLGTWLRRNLIGEPQEAPNQSGGFYRESAPAPRAQTSTSRPPSLRKPEGICICGCNGVPLTRLPEWSIDYNLYKQCPARLKRKQTGKYRDDCGVVREWRSSAAQRNARKQAEREAARKLKERQKALIANQKLEKEAKAKVDEAERDRNGLPAISRKEAVRRNLETYKGNDCKSKHGGLRYSFNGECVECRESNKKLRDAMKRGAFPRTLTDQEKLAITSIYAEARRLTRETGVTYHVDHIKPLSKGGEHHPDNLQIITAEENLKKGSSWDEEGKTIYRNQGVGRKEKI